MVWVAKRFFKLCPAGRVCRRWLSKLVIESSKLSPPRSDIDGVANSWVASVSALSETAKPISPSRCNRDLQRVDAKFASTADADDC